ILGSFTQVTSLSAIGMACPRGARHVARGAFTNHALRTTHHDPQVVVTRDAARARTERFGAGAGSGSLEANQAAPIRMASDTGVSTHGLIPKCFTTIVAIMFRNTSGISTFHARPISWSKRKRGSVQRTSM